MVMYKIVRRGRTGVKKSFARTDPLIPGITGILNLTKGHNFALYQPNLRELRNRRSMIIFVVRGIEMRALNI